MQSHGAVLRDIMKAKPKKLEEVAKTSLAGNLGLDDEQISKITNQRNWLGKLLDSDFYGLGVGAKEKDELLRDIRSKMESELQEKPKTTTKASDTRYNPQKHKLFKKADGKVYIFTKDGDEVGLYGKQ